MVRTTSIDRMLNLIDLPVNQSQDIEHGGHIWVVMSRGLLKVFQGLLAEGHSHFIPALGGILDHQVVEGPQAGWDLVSPLLGCCCCSTAMRMLGWRGMGEKKVRN